MVYDNPGSYKYQMQNTKGCLAEATPEESDTIASLTTDFETYYEELLTKLILGQQSLDDWDSYISDLQKLGMDELISIAQARYDRTQE